MTPVKIAANLSPQGVEGVRWVLVDDAESGVAPAPATEHAVTVAPARRSAWLWLLKLALVAAGLGLAWLAADRMVDPPPALARPRIVAAPRVMPAVAAPPPAAAISPAEETTQR